MKLGHFGEFPKVSKQVENFLVMGVFR